MKYAINRWTSRTTDADEAAHSGSYTCPVCFAPVTLRAGGERTAYFAHKPGAGTKDCELYHLGALTSSGHLQSTAQKPQWEMVLNVTLAKAGFPRAWGLQLFIPSLDDCEGEINVDVGGRVQKVTFSRFRKHKLITAEPQAHPYSIISTEITDRNSQTTLIKTCESLSVTMATPFGEGSCADGNPIPRTNILRRGGRYIFIWNLSLAPVFPSDLIVERLENSGDWHAALVDIPEDVCPESCIWLLSFCNLSVLEKLPYLSAVWPPLTFKTGAQLATVPRNATVYIGISGKPEKLGSRAIFYARSGSNDSAVSANPTATPVIKVSIEGESAFQMSCRNVPELQLEFDCSLEVDVNSLASGITFVGSAPDGSISSSRLHDQNSEEWLERIRIGELNLTEILAPPYCKGAIRAAHGASWQTIAELAIDPSDCHTGRPKSWNHFIPEIVKILRNRTVDIQIDFGNLGRIRLATHGRSDDQEESPLKKNLRLRLLSYLTQMPRRKNSTPVSVSWNDRDIVAAFYASNPVPKMLSSYRTLSNELNPVIALPKGKMK